MATLFEKFAPVSKAAWLAKVEKDLKGKAIETLNWQINEAISISPFAHADDWEEKPTPIANQRSNNAWEIGVNVKVGNMTIANQEALNALNNGANALCFELSKSPSESDLQTLLKGIELEWISTHFSFKQKSWKRFLSFFVKHIQSKQLDVDKVACSFSFKGRMIENVKDAATFQQMTTVLPKAQLMTLNMHGLSKGDALVVEELAQTIFKGNEVLTQFHEYGFAIADFYQQIQFSITLGDSYFLNIAKIRALKLLWQQVLTAWDKTISATANIEIHLTTTTQTKDENYNKIKATAQAMSAVIGGTNRLYIYPSDEFKDKVGTPFAQRIALNIQHLLQLESYMDRVIDPSAGSYYIENLTDSLAQAAWKKFQALI